MERTAIRELEFKITDLETEDEMNGRTTVTAISLNDEEVEVIVSIRTNRLDDKTMVRNALVDEYKNQLVVLGKDLLLKIGDVL